MIVYPYFIITQSTFYCQEFYKTFYKKVIVFYDKLKKAKSFLLEWKNNGSFFLKRLEKIEKNRYNIDILFIVAKSAR